MLNFFTSLFLVKGLFSLISPIENPKFLKKTSTYYLFIYYIDLPKIENDYVLSEIIAT